MSEPGSQNFAPKGFPPKGFEPRRQTGETSITPAPSGFPMARKEADPIPSSDWALTAAQPACDIATEFAPTTEAEQCHLEPLNTPAAAEGFATETESSEAPFPHEIFAARPRGGVEPADDRGMAPTPFGEALSGGNKTIPAAPTVRHALAARPLGNRSPKLLLIAALGATTLLVLATLGFVGLSGNETADSSSDGQPPKSPAISWGLGPQLVLPETTAGPVESSTVPDTTTSTTTTTPSTEPPRVEGYRPSEVPVAPAPPVTAKPEAVTTTAKPAETKPATTPKTAATEPATTVPAPTILVG